MHGVGGILGTLLAGVFSSVSLGVFSGYGFAEGIETMFGQLKVQGIGVVATVTYTAIVTFVLVKLTAFITAGIRVTKDEETQGLDLVLHEESGYKL